jgi:hypothetical protein
MIEATGGSLFSHTDAPNNAHEASAISLDGHPTLPLYATNVEAAIDELTGRVPPRPPLLGEWQAWTHFTAIPDWGWAKLGDGELETRSLIGSTTTAGADMFPYYWEAPSPTLDNRDPEWDEVTAPDATAWFIAHPGLDPDTDWLFNTGSTLAGSGGGQVFAGGFTRDGIGADDPVIETLRVGTRPAALAVAGPGTGLPVRQEVVVSGAVFPADRGVLALIHWPAGIRAVAATPADFLAVDPGERVVAALLLGQGVLGDKCIHNDQCGAHVCDGEAGGMFAPGLDADGKYDPFSYPSQAGGQYNLTEIHRGIDSIDGNALKAPFDDFTGLGDGARHINSEIPGAGQVRLGTDPAADTNSTYAFPAMPYGIPILGGSQFAYIPNPSEGWETTVGQNANDLGDTVILTNLGEAPGFFQYRLPYLKDYTTDGLKWTPQGNDPTVTREKARYFTPAAFSAGTFRDGTAVPATLDTAGHYQNPFTEDFWPWQIARFRHMFMLPSAAAVGEKEDIGSYWLVHFKREQDFEAFVRDGVMPWDATDGYEIYGSSLISTTDFEAQANLVNQETSSTVAAPAGPAPSYGMGADSYHPLRASFLLDPNDPTTLPAFTTAFEWSVTNAVGAGTEHITFISGVAYFTPRNIFTGARNFFIDTLEVSSDAPHGFWDASYRVDSDSLTGGSAAPALISSPNPMFLGLEAFGYGAHPSNGSGLSITLPLGVPGVGEGEVRNVRHHRLELPFTYLGSNGSGQYNAANGPAEVDPLNYGLISAWELEGDSSDSAFSKDAGVRAYFRRPLGHLTALGSALPYTAVDGHGVALAKTSGETILLHTTRWDEVNKIGLFGNFTAAGHLGAFPSVGFAEQFASSKDTTESFLDETYRVNSFISGTDLAPLYGSALAGPALEGPGLGAWAGGPVEIPVRIGNHTSWEDISWLQTGMHTLILKTFSENSGLQVSGLPDINGPVTDAADARFPSSGLLMYPQDDLRDPLTRPLGNTDGGTDFTGNQPDYSAFPAVDDVLTYLRTFDAAFSKDASPEVGVDGQPFVYLKLLGVQLRDLTYAAPGPGGQEDGRVSVLLKVPGLTTWMDVGRADGAGPSKQDVALDGGGCQVAGPKTFDGVDDASGMVYCQVKCNVGPAVNLFKNVGAIGGNYDGGDSPSNEVPVLVKVTMRGTSGGDLYNLENEHDGATFVGAATPGTSLGRRRGLVRMEVLRLSEV